MSASVAVMSPFITAADVITHLPSTLSEPFSSPLILKSFFGFEGTGNYGTVADQY